MKEEEDKLARKMAAKQKLDAWKQQ